MKVKVGFLVNPIAGMGGSVGLKGTDNELLIEALKRGAKPVTPYRAERFIRKIECIADRLEFVTPPSVMGGDYVKKYMVSAHVLDMELGSVTSREDTIRSCSLMLNEGVELVVFVGGDGTARDIYSVIGTNIPMLGVPSGVKMYSGVFAASPEAAAEIVRNFVNGIATIELGDIADVDERYLSRDEIRVRIYGFAKVPYLSDLLVPSKDFLSGGDDEKEELAEYMVREVLKPKTLYILGPGSTIKSIASKLGIEKTLLGVDAVYEGTLVGRDLSEEEVLNLLRVYDKAKIIVSPIGRQGFLFGRGNQQLSPRVLRMIGRENIIVVSTRSKISNLKFLRVDTGDPLLDRELEGFIRVIVGYNEEVVIRIISYS